MIQPFLRFEFQKILSYFKTKTLAKAITTTLFLAVFVFIGLGIYGFFISGFRFINFEAVEDIRLALTLYLYEVFLIVLSGVIVFSALVSGIFNLFKSDTNNWILSSPGYRVFPKIVLIKSILTSSLPSLIMFIPAVLAFHRVNHLGVTGILLILVSVLLLLLLLNSLTLLFIVGAGSVYYQVSKKLKTLAFTFKGLVVFLVLLVATVVALIWKAMRSVDLVRVFKADVDTEVLSLSNISSHFHFLPTHPFAMEILHLQNNELSAALLNFCALFLFASISGYLWWRFSYIFYPLWQKFQEGSSKQDRDVDSPFGVARSSYHFDGSIMTVLFKKEILVFSRNLKGMLWFLFLSVIWLMQIGANVILGHNIARHTPDLSERLAILQALQFIIAIYFISSFSLRFVFPSFSVDKKTSWILGTAPLSFKKIFFGKYIFYTTFFVILGVLMSYANTLVLGLSTAHALYSLLLLITAIVFIVTLGLSLGALFPSLDTDDPEVISTSMPGLFFTALSLIYGALCAFTLYNALIKGNLLWLFLLVIVTSLVTVGILLRTPKHVDVRSF